MSHCGLFYLCFAQFSACDLVGTMRCSHSIVMYNQTLTLVNTPADRGAEKSIENALRGCLLVAAFSAIFSSLFSDKMLTRLVHHLASYHYSNTLGFCSWSEFPVLWASPCFYSCLTKVRIF